MATLLDRIVTRIASAHAPRASEARTKSQLSEKAQKLGLYTVADVEREFREARQGWSGASAPPHTAWWHCPICDHDFWSPSGARKHMKANKMHHVLRMDWYEEFSAEAIRD